jgi:amino acid adenylation domain-containing protein
VTLLEQRLAVGMSRSPQKPAIESGDATLSYAELDALANRFAHAFLASGLKPGDRVGLHLPRSGKGVAAMVGALRAGAVYVPLDPSSPPSRMELIAKDCGLRAVVIAPQLLANWVAAGVGKPVEDFFLSAEGGPAQAAGRLHSWAELLGADASPFPVRSASPDELAYILYTSGSTGVPKGVMLSHRNATAFVDWAADQIALGPEDRVASVAPFHFDLSVFDIWATLSRGATVVVVDEATVVSGRRMLDRIQSAKISVWYSVPTALTLMHESGGLPERGAPSLRAVFFAGEVFPIKHLRAVMSALPGVRFWNLFGPTETNVCTAYEVPGPPPADAAAIPIGRVSCGDTLSILDGERRPVPEGETGELFIDGPTVMLGYWDGGRRAPAPHPYPTGDLVSRRPDGEIMYHGRRDHMVKIHGFRVELGEVEATLNAHPKLKEVICFAVEQQLFAVAVPSDPAVSVLEVKRHCAERLPKYMIPGEVRLVQALPRTSSGKADRVRTKAAATSGDTQTLPPITRAAAEGA